MDANLLQLARDLVAHPKWEWKPGMRDIVRGLRVVRGTEKTAQMSASAPWVTHEGDDVGTLSWLANHGPIPDLRDAATAGCLLEILGDAFVSADRHGAPRVIPTWTVRFQPEIGRVAHPDTYQTKLCSCLGEAAARALLACWRPV